MSMYSSLNRAHKEWIIFSFLAGFAVVVCGGFMSAYVLTQLWEWFIVPAFGLPSMSFVAAFGIMLISGLLSVRIQKEESENAEPSVYLLLQFFIPVLNPLLILVLGWLVHLFA